MKKKNKIKSYLLSLVFFCVFSLLYTGARVAFASEENLQDYTGPSDNLFNLRIPKNLHFAGEPIPQNDYSIKENMERVLNGRFEKSTAFILFNRAATWFPLIEKILKKNNIPDDFKYIALAESRLTNCISPQGAVGFWQFVASTGSHYGLEIREDVDERYNIEKSTEAACRFFKEAHRKFNNWTIVAAAYNLGMGGIENHLKKQNTTNYYDLLMNKETSSYMYKILALKTVFTNANKTFYGGRNIYNIPTNNLKIDSSITNLSDFAVQKGYNSEILKTFNPWLISNSLLNPERKTYIIKLPKKEYLKKLSVASAADTVSVKKDSALVLPVLSDTAAVMKDTIKTEK